jgi:surface antigen
MGDGGKGSVGIDLGRAAALLTLLVMLAACAGPAPPAPQTAALPATPAAPDGIHPYRGDLIQCVPYVRQVSGIDIMGDAWTWWGAAAGRYDRGHEPRVMAVLVLSRTQRLKLGHVAMVVDVEGPRQISVTHANFGSDPVSRRIIFDHMPVMDVSSGNDWSLVRFWNYDARAWGIVYPAEGFIYSQSTVAGSQTASPPPS